MNMENMRCVRVLFDDFEKQFNTKMKTLNLPCPIHLAQYGDGLVIEYYQPDDYEGKCPYVLNDSDVEVREFAKEIVGFTPQSVIPFGESVYCVAPADML